ncbi:MAG TPA: multiheme c-type cytochrome, partial [Gemmataceae bacterium]|nr:multiheme c-type cytochrome [Gemmataceae bacterium]
KTKRYIGVSECANCHRDPDKYKDAPPILCTCNEVAIWEKMDKHKDAYVNLSKERGQQITTLLKYKKSDIENNCLPCHGVRVEDQKFLSPTFKADEGVSCVVCHGPYVEWVEQHGGPRRFEWREKSRAEKENDFGMTDLWNPARRARKCASCHIGDPEDGKLVTHDMYAAGHPPLPGLEVSTFSKEMPKHWKYLYEKSEKAKQILHYNPAVLERTQLVIVGGLVELQESMNVLAGYADRSLHAKEADARALDLAAFDCYACHHDLKTPSWRQARGYFGKPGRPQFRSWPTALVKVWLHQSGQEDELAKERKLEEILQAAFDARPFGEPARIAAAAHDIQKWCTANLEKLERAPESFHQPSVRRLLPQICKLATSETLDFDSARQLAWAFRIVYKDLNPKPASDATIQEKLKALEQELSLKLPSGQQRQILRELPSILATIANYNPESFKKLFGELATLLEGKQVVH